MEEGEGGNRARTVYKGNKENVTFGGTRNGEYGLQDNPYSPFLERFRDYL